MSSLVLNKNGTDKDVLKNIANFFYESINSFKSTLTELSVSIENFLNSLENIEAKLNEHGFDYQENSPVTLYERLTKNKTERVEKQKDFISKLTEGFNRTQGETNISQIEIVQENKQLTPPPTIESIINKKQLSDRPRPPIVIKQEKTQLTKSPILSDSLKKEMLENIRKIKRMMKNK
ncbi:MAG: hypothetical protein ACFFDN_03090 [Candidatus Hodarchaeota archaeon]